MMNKLRFPQKLILLSFINVIALSVVIYKVCTQKTEHIHVAQKELDGIALIQPILKKVQNLQRHIEQK